MPLPRAPVLHCHCPAILASALPAHPTPRCHSPPVRGPIPSARLSAPCSWGSPAGLHTGCLGSGLAVVVVTLAATARSVRAEQAATVGVAKKLSLTTMLPPPCHHTSRPRRLQLPVCPRVMHGDRTSCALCQAAPLHPGVAGPAAHITA